MMTIRVISILFLGMVINHHAKAQREGDTWMIGYTQTANHPQFSVMHLDFTSGNLELKWDREEVFKFSETATNICDLDGEPLLWTNGMQVRGKGHINIIDTIAFEDEFYNYWLDHYWEDLKISEGFSVTDGAVILPVPSTINQYYIIYHQASRNNPFYDIDSWLYSKVVFQENGQFQVDSKNLFIIPSHQWFSGSISAVRHANGVDWWLIAFEIDSPVYYAFLADHSGIKLHHNGPTNINYYSSTISQAVFSPTGDFLAWTYYGQDNLGQRVCLFSFDRCEGNLIFIDSIPLGEDSSIQGVAFSQTGRFLYFTSLHSQLWRLDMYSQDIIGSAELVGEYDGFLEPQGGEQTSFGPMMQTPDGRIYIVPVAGSSQYLHVIDRPDEENPEDIRLLQHHISLVVRNGRTAPNIPNFRLGPLDGSPCDTLGMDNLAQSRWRWEPDIASQPLSIRFTDLSFYEPTTWHWDFGDGQTSDEVHPIHTFSDYGSYYVCQTVSNQYATDSTCQWVEIVPYTSDKQPNFTSPYFISPNPFNDELSIRSDLDTYSEAMISLYDVHGRTVMSPTRLPVPISINMSDVPAGLYILKLEVEGSEMQVFKVVKE